MDVIGEIVRNVTLLVILMLFLELILPRGELNGFIRMIMGLLLLSAVLNPFLEYIGREPFQPVYNEEDYSRETAEILEEGAELSSGMEDKAISDYEKGINGQIGALVSLVQGVSEVKTEVTCDQDTGAIQRIFLEVVKGDQELSAEDLGLKIKKTVCEFYGLDEKVLDLEISEREEMPNG